MILSYRMPLQIKASGIQSHKIIVQIAKSKLDKSVTDMVDYYLKGMAWEESACCMDETSKNKNNDYIKPWHYVSIAKDKTYVKTKEINIISQLELNLNVLKNRSLYPIEFIGESLKIVFHLIGDISQPLHCGYPEDKCGNMVQVKFLNKTSNLHKVWDSDILQEKNIDLWSCAKLIMSFSQTEMNEIEKTDPTLWTLDSRSLLPMVYDIKGGVIDKAYIDKNIIIIEKQLVKSGLRLAELLNQTFASQ